VILLRDFEPTERTSFVDRGFQAMGIAGWDQLRVLLCDGPALVAWVGAYRVDAFDEEARASIQAIVPALQWRLQLEGWSVRSAALGAVIEAIPTPAFLLRDERTVLHANAAGERMLEEEGVALLEVLSRHARAKVATPGVHVTPVEASGLGRVCLVVLEGSSIVDAQHARVSCAAKRWGLTSRQCAILLEVSQGASNRAIAASLGISARTVEQHLTTIFEKAQVETRTELVVRALRGG
jgi:DNA-binding CsgD family transcriptional regulator